MICLLFTCGLGLVVTVVYFHIHSECLKISLLDEALVGQSSELLIGLIQPDPYRVKLLLLHH